MPGVSQDQFGQFHVRDEHNGVQYRLNGVILPESIAVFGQTLSPRLIEKLDLVTGTLPAQYGLRTAGIIEITTKSGLKDATTLSLYGGAHSTIEPSIQLSGSSGATSWFASGDYKHNALGIDNVNGATSALHDKTDQFSTFGYIDHILGDNDRIAFTGGFSNQHFQIPNAVGLVGTQPDREGNPVAVNGIASFASEALNQTQLQATGFGAISLLHSAGAFSAQTSLFLRSSALDYHPDVTGELLFSGMAQAPTPCALASSSSATIQKPRRRRQCSPPAAIAMTPCWAICRGRSAVRPSASPRPTASVKPPPASIFRTSGKSPPASC